jgi:hypothetical protein
MFNLFGKKAVVSVVVAPKLQDVSGINFEAIKRVFAHRDMCQAMLENDHSTFDVEAFDQMFIPTEYVAFKKEEQAPLSVAESMFEELFGSEYHAVA